MRVLVNNQTCVVELIAPLVAGTVGIRTAEFEFSSDWDGLEKMAVFQSSANIGRVMEIVDDKCEIPWEAISKPGNVKVGVIGVKGDTRYPTIWSQPIPVIQGAVANGGKSGIYSRAFLEQTLERARQSVADAAGYASQAADYVQHFAGSLEIKGVYPTLAALEAAVTAPEQGDVYYVGSSVPYTMYIWDTTGSSRWINAGRLVPRFEYNADTGDLYYIV